MGLRQQRCRPEVQTLLLQPPTHPRWMLNKFQTLAALRSLQGASRVFHELDRQVLLSRALAKRPFLLNLFVRVDITHVLNIHRK